jgi:DeoR/GlpR family transcriptional regulator of sugar metabolism
VIKDVSEKTIQRELISLIEAGIILKTGERRWSRYSIKN